MVEPHIWRRGLNIPTRHHVIPSISVCTRNGLHVFESMDPPPNAHTPHPTTLQSIVNAIGYPLQLDIKTLFLKHIIHLR